MGTTQRAPASTRYRTVRLQCRLPSLLPLFKTSMESQQAKLVLYEHAEGVPEQHSGMRPRNKADELAEFITRSASVRLVVKRHAQGGIQLESRCAPSSPRASFLVNRPEGLNSLCDAQR